jgi:thiol-disulfide isomerase/thioredoxin
MKRCLLAAIFFVLSLTAGPAAETPSELKPFVRGSWQEVLRSHKGRPTLVHFWGVTCGPCKVELPLLGQFMKDHSELDVVMISADLVPNLPGAARAMLEKAGLGSAETGFSATALSNVFDLRSIRPGRARSRARC